MNLRRTTEKSLDNMLAALSYSNNCLSENMSAYHTMIRENHLRHLPTKLEKPLSEYFELEGLVIKTLMYRIYYTSEITSLRHKDYELKICQISVGITKDINNGYKPLAKLDNNLYEEILTAVHNHYEKYFFDDDLEAAQELRWEQKQGI